MLVCTLSILQQERWTWKDIPMPAMAKNSLKVAKQWIRPSGDAPCTLPHGGVEMSTLSRCLILRLLTLRLFAVPSFNHGANSTVPSL